MLSGHAEQFIIQDSGIVRDEMTRPSVLFRPTLKLESNGRWVAEYGDLKWMARGDSPEEAMREFDRLWRLK